MADATDQGTDIRDAVAVLETRLRADELDAHGRVTVTRILQRLTATAFTPRTAT